MREEKKKHDKVVYTVSSDEEEATTRKKDLEKFRKMKWCLVPGCLARSQKKLSNHIIHAHTYVTVDKRACYLKRPKQLDLRTASLMWSHRP